MIKPLYLLPGILLSLFLLACEASIPPPIESISQPRYSIQEIISRKWKGVTEIPPNLFADSGWHRTNCYSFSNVASTNVTYYDWKSDIYSNNYDPQEAWFYSADNKELDSISIDDIGGTSFYFILRYNVSDTHLDIQYTNRKDGKPDGKPYSISFVLNSIATKATNSLGKTSFKDYSLYIPVYARNLVTNTSPATIELNFGVNLDAKNYVNQNQKNTAKEWNDIFDYLKGKIGNDMNLVRTFWTTYTEVTNVENGFGGCPNI